MTSTWIAPYRRPHSQAGELGFKACRQRQVGTVRGIPESSRGLYLWSSLSRKIFKSSDVDIARIIGHLHPASLKDDWGEKRKP